MKNRAPVEFYDRKTGVLQTEKIFGEGALRWVYETHLGQIALRLLIRRALFSKAYGALMSRPSSRNKIAPFIEKYGIDASEFELPPEKFSSFNDFFSRKIKTSARPIAGGDNVAILPADGRHLAFQRISAETRIFAKGQGFDLAAFVGDNNVAKRYAGGALVCTRLCPTDYHRFHFPVAGTPSEARKISGALNSVNPIALTKKISMLWENKRIVVEIASPRFGNVLMVIVGATNVGTIVPVFSPYIAAEKGAELGYFRFGGSFVATIFEPGKIALAEDLVANTARGFETFAKMGEALGTATTNPTR